MEGKRSIHNAPVTRQKYEKVELVFPVARFISGYLAPPVRRWLTDGATKMPPLRGFRFFFEFMCSGDMCSFSDHHWLFGVRYSVFCGAETRRERQHQRWNGTTTSIKQRT